MTLDLEYTPGIEWHASGEVTDELAQRWKVDKPRPDVSPVIKWGDGHSGAFDRVGRFADGRPLFVQVGIEKRKAGPQWEERFAAERRRAELEGGEYWFGGERSRSSIRFHNFLWLRRFHLAPTDTDRNLERRVMDRWRTLGDASLREIIEPLGREVARPQLIASAWRTVAIVQAALGLRIDLDDVVLTLDEPLGCPTGIDQPLHLHPDRPDRTPPPEVGGLWGVPGLPCDLGAVGADHRAKAQVNEDLVLRVVRDGQSPTDFMRSDSISRAELDQIEAASADDTRSANRPTPADPYDRTDRWLEGMVAEVRRHGWWKVIPYARDRERDGTLASQIPAVLAEAARLAYHDVMVRTAHDLLVHPRVTQAREALAPDGSERYELSESQARFLIAQFEADPRLRRIRSGDTTYRGKHGELAYRLTIPFPGLVQQVDYHTEDQVVKLEGLEVMIRPALMALVDVAYGVPTGWLEVPGVPNEGDYIDLVIQSVDAAEKAALMSTYRVEGDWPSALAGMIVADWGWIFAAAGATDFLIDKLFVVLAWGPVRTPAVRGTVETVFRAHTSLTHREPASTGSSSLDRRSFDPWKAARRYGLHWEIFRGLNVASLVTVFLRGWDQMRGLCRIVGWKEAEEAFGVPQFLGTGELLRLQALKDFTKGRQTDFLVHPDRTVRAFSSEYTTSEGWLSHLVGRTVQLKYRKKDITRLYVYVGPDLQGIVSSRRYDHRVSEWEHQKLAPGRNASAAAARTQGRETLATLVRRAAEGKKLSQKDSRRVFRRVIDDLARHDDAAEAAGRSGAADVITTRGSSLFTTAVREAVEPHFARLVVTIRGAGDGDA